MIGRGAKPVTIRDALITIIKGYRQATEQPFAQHPLASFLRNDARAAIDEGLGEFGRGLRVVGSAGAGNWATVPWIAVFDTARHRDSDEGLLRRLSFPSQLAGRASFPKPRDDGGSSRVRRRSQNDYARPG